MTNYINILENKIFSEQFDVFAILMGIKKYVGSGKPLYAS